MRCLDQELHLLMKHQVEGHAEACYSLSHDYLVQPIKNWLAIRDTETWKGRARSKLAQAAIRLKREPNSRQLLSTKEWAAASFAVPKSLRSELQQKVMVLGRRRAMKWMGTLCLLGLVSMQAGSILNSTRKSLLVSLNRAQGERISSFLAAKSDSLRSIWERILANGNRSKDILKELNTLVEQKEPLQEKQLLRGDLLLSLEGLALKAESICECLAQSDENEMELWDLALQSDVIRDGIVKERKAKAGSAIPAGMPELELLFIKRGDMRLLTDFEAEGDPMLKVYEILAASEGSSDSELGRIAALLWTHSQRASKDALYIKLLAMHLIAMMEQPINIIGKPLTDFIATNIGSSDRAMALSCQTLQSYLVGNRTVVPPNEENGEWMVESCIASHPFVMIHLPVQRAQYDILEASLDGPAESKRKTLEIGPDVWLAREEVSVGLFRVFEKSVGVSSAINQKVSPDTAVRSVEREDILRFCNWLSDQAHLQPVYSLSESPPAGTPGRTWIQVQNVDGVFWNPDANGYRLPTFHESALAAVHGQPEHYWSQIGRHEGFQQRQMQRQQWLSNAKLVDSWMFFPNAWGFSGLMGDGGDVVLDDQDRLGFLPPTVSTKKAWDTFIPYDQTNRRVLTIRMARGAQPIGRTTPE
jgi:hypothetical protein